MKHYKLFLCAIISLLSLICNAQDVIIFKNGDEVSAIVNEISMDFVKYKKFSNPDGPFYTVPKSSIFMIKLQNGEKEIFDESYMNFSENVDNSSVVYDSFSQYSVTRKSPSGIATNNGMYYLNKYESAQFLGSNYEKFSFYQKKMNKGFNMLFGGAILRAISLPLIIVGVSSGHYGWDADDYYYGDYDSDFHCGCEYDDTSTSDFLIVSGVMCRIASSVLLPVGIVKFAKNKKRAEKILREYDGVKFGLRCGSPWIAHQAC